MHVITRHKRKHSFSEYNQGSEFFILLSFFFTKPPTLSKRVIDKHSWYFDTSCLRTNNSKTQRRQTQNTKLKIGIFFWSFFKRIWTYLAKLFPNRILARPPPIPPPTRIGFILIIYSTELKTYYYFQAVSQYILQCPHAMNLHQQYLKHKDNIYFSDRDWPDF